MLVLAHTVNWVEPVWLYTFWTKILRNGEEFLPMQLMLWYKWKQGWIMDISSITQLLLLSCMAHCKTRQQGDEKLNHALNVKLSRESRWTHKEYITCDAEQQFFKLPSPLLILIYPLQRSWSRSRRFCHLRMKPCGSIILSPLKNRAIFFSGLQLYIVEL